MANDTVVRKSCNKVAKLKDELALTDCRETDRRKRTIITAV